MTNQDKLKTGTTTLSLKFKDGILLAADKRATAGNIIAGSNMVKVYQITDKIAMTVAGSVSDIQLILKYIKAQLKLKNLEDRREISVKETANFLGSIVYSTIRSYAPGVVHFLVGGIDADGHHVYDLYPDGSVTEAEHYLSSGSGSMMVYGILDSSYKPNINEKQAKELAIKAISSAVKRDSASGNGIDLLIISEKGITKDYSDIINL